MIKNMVRHQTIQGIQLSTKEPAILCRGCQFGKQQRAHFPINSVRQRAQFPGDIIHADLCGPMSVPSKGRSLYFAIFKDDSTGYRFVFCIPRKSDALRCFQKVCKTIFKNIGRDVKVLRTNRGGEFANKAFDQYLAVNSIRREFTTPYTPEQNSVVERDNRTIMEGVRSSIFQAQVSLTFWAEAVQYIVYTLNRTGTRLLQNSTPYQAYTGIQPSIAHMWPFGCPCFIHVSKQLRKKLDAKSKAGIFLGYSEETKRYRLWIPEKQQVVTNRDVIFDENKLLTQSEPPDKCSTPPVSYLPVSLNMRTINPIPNPIGSTSETRPATIMPEPIEPQPIINLILPHPPVDTQDDPYDINFFPQNTAFTVEP
jgi:hypothetical protein